ncbi:MAG: formate-dependent phosphoribosylglycinamide formyltransferase [Candidatus Paraprevotella stercoravium]|jgi:phosphoribosylglycinamide formyltransferase 2|uniref:Formate-dependent phosphoribosylglycinamide formyltransferase n=2 Tax=Bacteroidales TaxID=171549 RepID=A0ABT7U801_9BACE|nr:formate-dependent phosphoribosylglycinamide formyltransferase [Candidatus Paraprevotella stercoravium]MDM8146639.1 formate-dependent phosphoribosylglycinamide formyltransferase [Bacteroides eggerthii]
MVKKILLLGSGELGKEFVIACKRKGQYVIACDAYRNAPAMQVADECEVFSMLDGEALMDAIRKHQPDIIVPEIESIRTEVLYDAEKMGIQVVPSAKAVNYTMNRKEIRELAHTELGLKTANYRYANNYEELCTAAAEIGFPCIIKPLMSSSGHGQSKVDSADELAKAWDCACQGARGDLKEVIVEQFIPFDSEITLLTVTQKNGPTLFCQPIGHVQKGGDYRESFQPAAITPEMLKDAQDMAEKITRALGGAGLWGVEFFLSHKEGVIFSELSPRPHDTGMVTLSGTQNLSEFELHCRAVLGLPIPEITQERIGASAVILSEVESKKPEYTGMEQVCAATNTYLRIFGKPEAHVGRRMGVVVCWDKVGSDLDALRTKCKGLAAGVHVTDGE